MPLALLIILTTAFLALPVAAAASLEEEFQNPPAGARPGVYWYFMDGNLSREAMTADLESMKAAGIGSVLFLEVDVGVPRGPAAFMSAEWQEMFVHAVREAERLGIEITLGSGPGWAGSGGPWVSAEQSMQHLVASSVEVEGPRAFHEALPVPAPRPPTEYSRLSEELIAERDAFYRDEAVLAFPTPAGDRRVEDLEEKALFDRRPFSSAENVKPYLPAPAAYPIVPAEETIARDSIVDLTGRLQPDGTLAWEVPPGRWTIMRFGARNNGSNTRPAPRPGLGFECDKLDAAALDDHFAQFAGRLIEKVGARKEGAGWTMMHIDSWEMGAQNWTAGFREGFRARRGYDPPPFYPAYDGRIVGSLEITERFLWDVRLTAHELVLENHAQRFKKLARDSGFGLSIEPYDMTPCADLDLGAVADIPMCEFWSDGYGFDTAYSCIEAASVAHIMGRPIVAAEAFTAMPQEGWRQHPGSMKNQGDWAFCMGVNRFVYHTFAHQPLGDEHRPGMTMGPFGVHWDRGQTWWPMATEYHRYVARCSHVLRQGVAVADVLYLAPEGAPHVFRPPPSALAGEGMLADKKGYSFDGCSPAMLVERADVQDGLIIFPGGSAYRVLVLPSFDTMTPGLLRKITALVAAGAALVGSPPQKSPSLSGYPDCDAEVKSLAAGLWGDLEAPEAAAKHSFGKGAIHWGGQFRSNGQDLYPIYEATAVLLADLGVPEDFTASGPVRFIHRRTADRDIYFLASKSPEAAAASCRFRIERGAPLLWHPVTGEIRALPRYERGGGFTTIPLKFEPYESYFVVFSAEAPEASPSAGTGEENFSAAETIAAVPGPWKVTFDPRWGGPGETVLAALEDWTQREEPGIRYYSGVAAYRTAFDLSAEQASALNTLLDLGTVRDIALVRLNGHELGVLWTAPWRVDVSGMLLAGTNQLEIDVANRWPNRLIGDQQEPDREVRTLQWPSGLLSGQEFRAGRYTFAMRHPYTAESELLPSGLLGPVQILVVKPSSS